jgi:hypothetical protein
MKRNIAIELIRLSRMLMAWAIELLTHHEVEPPRLARLIVRRLS